ncbi:unnamed protein product, partial [Discosporangium mesarthrocarpum]
MHPYSKFGTGNKVTLSEVPRKEGRNPRDALLKFFDRYYSPEQMTLAVLGKEPLSKLQRLADGLFSQVPSRGTASRPSKQWLGKVDPFIAGVPLQAFNVVPVQDIRQVSISWPMVFCDAAQRDEVLLTKPDRYIASLLGHEGPGSLLSYLKSKNWANELSVDSATATDDFATFEVGVDLTPEGLKNRYSVIAAIFSYLRLVRDKGIPSFLYKELPAIADLGWRFLEKQEPSSAVPGLARNLQDYAPELAVSGPICLHEVNASLVESLLDSLRPDFSSSTLPRATPLVTVTAKDFEKVARQREKWYNTAYEVEPLSSHLQEWSNPPLLPELALPGPNPFIPGRLDVIVKKARVPKPGDKPIPPKMLDNVKGVWQINHRLDDVFLQPKAYCYFELVTPKVYESPKGVALLRLFQLSLDERLNEYTYDAQVAGLGYNLDFTTRGVRLTFAGFNDKMPAFIEKVAEGVATHVPNDPAELERLRDVVYREMMSFDKQQPLYHAVASSALATEDPRFSVEDVRNTLSSIRLGDFPPLLKDMFRRGEAFSLLQGNLKEGDVDRYTEGMRKWFAPETLPFTERPERLIVAVPRTPSGCGYLIRRPEQNQDNENSASQLLFQARTPRSTESRVLSQLLGAVIEDPFYDSLRTKQQLGYLVFSGVKVNEGISSLYLIVQSPERAPWYLTERALAFLTEFQRELVSMPEDRLRDYAGGLIERKLEPDKRLSSEAGRNWDEIASGQFQFDRRIEEAAALRDMRKKDLLLFFDRHIAQGGPERRLVTSEVYSSNHATEIKNAKPLGGVLIDDIKQWRSEQTKYPPRPR